MKVFLCNTPEEQYVSLSKGREMVDHPLCQTTQEM